MSNQQRVPGGEENGSLNQSAFYVHPGIQHFIQPSPTSQTKGVESHGEDIGQGQGQSAGNKRGVFPRQRVRTQLSIDERRFLLAVQRGDIKATKRLIDADFVDKDCVDPMGRTALVLAIINEDLPMSWESLAPESRSFSSDITPLILAAHLNHFEIVRILLDRGATLPTPHDIRCGCCECVTSQTRDIVHHSRSRMNAFRALASPSLICLTAKDPILSAFQLSWELRRLSFEETEFRSEYEEVKNKCKAFATALLDHTRSSHELEIILNYDPLEPVLYSEGRMHLRRLRLAIKLHQKEFVTHPNVQQLLASIWYEDLPGFRRKNMFLQVFEIVRIAVSFPFLSLMYIMAPKSSYGQTLKKPFIKFICHSASYLTFLAILVWASQKKGDDGFKRNNNNGPSNYITRTSSQRAQPSIPEYLIVAWLFGMIKLEVRRMLGEENLKEYVKDMWKLMDLGTTGLYVIVIILRLLAYFEVRSYLIEICHVESLIFHYCFNISNRSP
ncbi:transient receptor potential-gamma protein-like isoform X2 [Zootermopsis nevadensis]|uniref:transient receptor potential-gamma protein-like isoform X2 n=1 Tax=Zootermopsis nevadensis TaxID=136037 RepID=UPI000B8EDFC2|nr:transient receptor potential-gamma protein-like isoform X2 [Zootermopsis nevadensis]